VINCSLAEPFLYVSKRYIKRESVELSYRPILRVTAVRTVRDLCSDIFMFGGHPNSYTIVVLVHSSTFQGDLHT
jgi:hypothetical protein